MRLVLAFLTLFSLAGTIPGQQLPLCDQFSTEYRHIERQATKKVSAPYPNEPGVRVKGDVVVRVEIDRRGNVTSAWAICGHPLLVSASVAAARLWKFRPFRLNGRRYKTSGIISFHFAPPEASS
jgi:outer membrane biosynthesis protein TonB